MLQSYDSQKVKKAANLSLNADLLRIAKELNINLSATLEQALIEIIKQRREAQWRAENQAAIEAYNAHVDAHGVFAEDERAF